jgi:hypothetical protein
MLLLHDIDFERGGSGRGAELAVVAQAACLDFAPDLSDSA